MNKSKPQTISIPQVPGFYLDRRGEVVLAYDDPQRGLVVGFQSDNDFSIKDSTVKNYGPYTPINAEDYVRRANNNIRFIVSGLQKLVGQK